LDEATSSVDTRTEVLLQKLRPDYLCDRAPVHGPRCGSQLGDGGRQDRGAGDSYVVIGGGAYARL
jgi:hypothetical protein